MFSEHVKVCLELIDTIEQMEKVVPNMPDSREKFQIELRLSDLKHTACDYFKNSLHLHDQIYEFVKSCAEAR